MTPDAASDVIRWEQGPDGVVVLILDDPGQSVNTINAGFLQSLSDTVARLEQLRDEQSLRGVVITSAKKTFFAGADLKELRRLIKEDIDELIAWVRESKSLMRRIETLGLPVVAAINGAALGGGFELALATHHRIVVDDPAAVVSFPEVQLGILPGLGGVTRTVRMVGIAQALMGVLLQSQRLAPAQATEQGFVDEIVPTTADLVPAAKRWIFERAETGEPTQQPWDADPKYRIPGGTPSTPSFAANLPAFPANLRKQLKGEKMPAPEYIMAAAVEGAQVDFDSALEIETRYFVRLATGQVAANMIQAFFFDRQRVTGARGRPVDRERYRAHRVVVLGAGMMGAAIAYVCARNGIEVVLKDVSLEAAQRGKQYSVGLVERAVERGRSTAEQGEELLSAIHPADGAADAAGGDLLIEAVFEDPTLKDTVLREIEPVLAPDALLGSNTSTLPITGLAESVTRPADFIGIHFFSPVDRMPLVELVKGDKTSEDAVFRALDFVKQIGKTPIVVNDSRGFFTSRVIGTFINEGISMLAEGVPPATIEQASSQAGYPAPVLQLSDELNMKLMRKIRLAAEQDAGESWKPHPAQAVIDRMLDEFDRPGRLEGRGFYEYDDGKRVRLWRGLGDAFPAVENPFALSLRDLEERMLFIEALEAVKCFEQGVIDSVADANIGSIMGIGFPPWTGGVLQYINGYIPASSSEPAGLPGFVVRARQLASLYGERFQPPPSLVARADRGEQFSDELVTETAV